ncbi:MAG: DUF1902 domain-containing protein [Pseudomonadota bacterium]
MNKRTFYIKAIWDEEASIFVSESDIIGLHIEASSIEEFEEVMWESATEIIVENHIKPQEFEQKELRDLIPGIVFKGVSVGAAAT